MGAFFTDHSRGVIAPIPPREGQISLLQTLRDTNLENIQSCLTYVGTEGQGDRPTFECKPPHRRNPTPRVEPRKQLIFLLQTRPSLGKIYKSKVLSFILKRLFPSGRMKLSYLEDEFKTN